MKRIIYCIMVFALLLAGCASAGDINDRPLSAASPTSTATAQPSDTPRPTPTFTPSLTPTDSPQPSATYTPSATPSPTPTTPLCTNKATFIRHLSVSDNTKLQPGVYFAKVWRIQNTGTCTWTTKYSLVFDSGDDFSSPAETPLTREVKPGETVDVQVSLRTPFDPATYAGNWMLRDEYGNLFGFGDTGKQPLSASVIVIPYKANERKETLSCG